MARVLISRASRAGAASVITELLADELRTLGHVVDVADLKQGAASAGRYVPEAVGLVKRLFLRTLQQSAQDHVDENAVRIWACELAEFAPV